MKDIKVITKLNGQIRVLYIARIYVNFSQNNFSKI